MKRKLAGAAITMLLAVLAAGCGGSGDDTTTEPAPAALTKPELIMRADTICGAAKAQIEAGAKKLREAGKKTGTLATPIVTQFLEKTSLPAYETMLGGLRGLAPPVADQGTIDGYVAALASAIDKVKADPVAYSKNPAPDDPFDDPTARARAYGMKVCGS